MAWTKEEEAARREFRGAIEEVLQAWEERLGGPPGVAVTSEIVGLLCAYSVSLDLVSTEDDAANLIDVVARGLQQARQAKEAYEQALITEFIPFMAGDYDA